MPTNDKTVEGSIREVFNMAKATEHRVVDLDDKDVKMEDGSIQNLDQVNKPLATAEYVDKEISKIPPPAGGGITEPEVKVIANDVLLQDYELIATGLELIKDNTKSLQLDWWSKPNDFIFCGKLKSSGNNIWFI